MSKRTGRKTTAVLVHIEDELYEKYVKSIEKRSMKRQSYSAKLFTQAIQEDLAKYETNKWGLNG